MKSSKKLDNLHPKNLTYIIDLTRRYAKVQDEAITLSEIIDKSNEKLQELMLDLEGLRNEENNLYVKIAQDHGITMTEAKSAIMEILLAMKKNG